MSDPPNRPDRAGNFQPIQSWWDRHFNSKPRKADDVDSMIFPAEKAFPNPPGGLPDALYSVPPPKPVSPKFKKKRDSTRSANLDTEIDVPNGPAFLRKKTSTKERWKYRVERKRKKPIKFGTVEELSSSDDEGSEPEKEGKGLVLKLGAEIEKDGRDEKGQIKRPLVVANPPSYSSDVSSAPTLVDGRQTVYRPPIIPTLKEPRPWDDSVDIDYDKELERLQARLGSRELPTYSDDEDIGVKSKPKTAPNTVSTFVEAPASTAWSPAFLHRHQSQGTESKVPSLENAALSPMIVPPIPGAVPLPATPSLIRAIDRITVAQKDAFGVQAPESYPSPQDAEAGLPQKHGQTETSPRRWDEFWREVSVKAQD